MKISMILVASAVALSACATTNQNFSNGGNGGGFRDQCAASALTTSDCEVIMNDDEIVEDRGGVTGSGNTAAPVIVTPTAPEPTPIEPTPEIPEGSFGSVIS